ncbi:thrombospondin type-1 domain-containing protein [Bdellovibrio bacteriovorus]|uniref:thrombospondin type-1 domain-containing protein n=1 Tax=Bdellovibrio bacteriovorus TaxID=959 RepID=UPI0035A6369D
MFRGLQALLLSVTLFCEVNAYAQGFTPYFHHLIRYSWDSGAWGSCSGGTGTWNYSAWSACAGGSGSWSYGAWGACSVSCGGGTQTRSATCNFTANSGSQTRTATCDKTANSGSQNRTVSCENDKNQVVTDFYCGGGKPSQSQSCTPSSDAVCGSSTLSQVCTPSNPAVCGVAQTSQACNTQACCTNANNTLNSCAGNTFDGIVYGSPTDTSDPQCLALANQQCANNQVAYCSSDSATLISYDCDTDNRLYYTCRCN